MTSLEGPIFKPWLECLFFRYMFTGAVCAQVCQQCGVGPGVHAENVQSVFHPCLSSCFSQCLLPAACAAPMPAASACPVRWMQHVKTPKLTCMRLKSTTSSWILTTIPAGHCILSVRVCVRVRVILCILWRFFFAKILALYQSGLIDIQSRRQRIICCKEEVSSGLNFIIHLSSFEVCVSMCLFPVYVCVWERGGVHVSVSVVIVIGVSYLTLLEEASSVERGGLPVSPVFSQTPAHENLFRWVQYCNLSRYQPTFRPFKPIKDLYSPHTPPTNLSSSSGP